MMKPLFESLEMSTCKRVADLSGTLVVLESGIDVPFAFNAIHLIDIDGTEVNVGCSYPFFVVAISGAATIRSGIDQITVESPNDVVVNRVGSLTTARAVSAGARLLVVSSKPTAKLPLPRRERGVAEVVSLPHTEYGGDQGGGAAWGQLCPFNVKRIYYTHAADPRLIRGGHAHIELEQLLVAASGSVRLTLERAGESEIFELLDERSGVLISPVTWRDIEMTRDSCLLVLASDHYQETDYIRDYETFLKH